MPEAPTQDINYQPKIDQYSFQKPFLKTQQAIKSIFLFLLTIVLLLVSFIVILLALNYFNIVSLSQIYPEYFLNLPHQSFAGQNEINRRLLSESSNFSRVSNSWTISATLFRIQNETIYLKYKGQLVTILLNKDTSCYEAGQTTTTANGTQTPLKFSDCSSVLNNINKGKPVTAEYNTNEQGNYKMVSIILN